MKLCRCEEFTNEDMDHLIQLVKLDKVVDINRRMKYDRL